jgi:hypothetical protein
MMRWHLGGIMGVPGSTPEAKPSRAGRYMGKERPAKAGVQEAAIENGEGFKAYAGATRRVQAGRVEKSVEKGRK